MIGARSVRRLISLEDLPGYTATVAHPVPVRLRPGPDLGALLPAQSARPLAGTPATALTGVRAPRPFDERLRRVTQLLVVLVAQINLICRAVKREGDRLTGLAAIEIVDENHLRMLGHPAILSPLS